MSTGVHQHRLADGQLVRADLMDRSGTAHRDRTRQDLQQIADGAPAALHRHPFQLLGDEHEQRHKKGRAELADRRGRDHGETHREFHRHAPLDDVCGGLRDNGPAADGEAEHPQDAITRVLPQLLRQPGVAG